MKGNKSLLVKAAKEYFIADLAADLGLNYEEASDIEKELANDEELADCLIETIGAFYNQQKGA